MKSFVSFIDDFHLVAMLVERGYLIKSFERTILFYLQRQNIEACKQVLHVASKIIIKKKEKYQDESFFRDRYLDSITFKTIKLPTAKDKKELLASINEADLPDFIIERGE